MKTLIFLLRKEFKQIFRNKSILAIIFMMPTVQCLILPLAADYEIKNINLSVIDNDKSTYSTALVNTVITSGYFKLQGNFSTFSQAFKTLESDQSDLILEIPSGFERNLIRENKQTLFVAVNAINGTKANLGGMYITSIINNYNSKLLLQLMPPSRFNGAPTIEVASSYWFNPLLNYKSFIVPGILALLVTMVGGFLAALNIVKEKEIGTIEQINVTPISKGLFILAKLIPFWILANIVFTIGLLIARFVYGIIPIGNLGVLYAFVSLYLLAILGFGLLISSFCNTQQQAMLIMFFFMMIFILMGGLFTPIESMPQWAQTIAWINPVSHLISVMRMVILKGSSFADIFVHTIYILLMAIVLNVWAVITYKKTS